MFSTPKGPYEEVKLRIESETNKKNPSLAIDGYLKLSSVQRVPVRFELSHDLRFRFEIKQENDPFFFKDDFLYFFLLHVDLIKGFQNIDHHLWKMAEMEEGLQLLMQIAMPSYFNILWIKLELRLRLKWKTSPTATQPLKSWMLNIK